MKCEFCYKEYPTIHGLRSHIWRAHTENGIKHNPNLGYKDKRQIWNKGLTKEIDERVKKLGETLSNNIKNGITKPSFLGRKHSKESIEKMKVNSGGYRRGSGRGKSGIYKGYWCDSSWELAWVIYHLDHKINFKRNRKKFPYVYREVTHNYIPDFVYENETFVEIKGYMLEKDVAKIDQFEGKLVIFDKENMENMLFYCKKFYGEDFYKLYDNRPK